jgi:ankyrin repeat protein
MESIRDEFIKARMTIKSNINEFRRIVSNNRKLLKVKQKDGNTLLHLACFYERFEVVKYLLELGADVESSNQVF